MAISTVQMEPHPLFFYRAYYGDGKPVGGDEVNLESQVWALIGDTFQAPEDRQTLVARIGADLDDPSPTGAMLVPGGEVWPAISGLLTWGYGRVDPERAWRHWARNTMAAHAQAFPWIWYGVWSSPDGMSSVFGEHPGEAWASVVTPMTDYPVQNNNQHTMPMLAALRMAGVEATANGVRLVPVGPDGALGLRTELLDLERRGGIVRGRYRPIGRAARKIELHARPGEELVGVRVNHAEVWLEPGADTVILEAGAGQETAFEAESVAAHR